MSVPHTLYQTNFALSQVGGIQFDIYADDFDAVVSIDGESDLGLAIRQNLKSIIRSYDKTTAPSSMVTLLETQFPTATVTYTTY